MSYLAFLFVLGLAGAAVYGVARLVGWKGNLRAIVVLIVAYLVFLLCVILFYGPYTVIALALFVVSITILSAAGLFPSLLPPWGWLIVYTILLILCAVLVFGGAGSLQLAEAKNALTVGTVPLVTVTVHLFAAQIRSGLRSRPTFARLEAALGGPLDFGQEPVVTECSVDALSMLR